MREEAASDLNKDPFSAGVGLADVLPFLVGLGRTGRLSSSVVEDRAPDLEVWIERGRVVDATWGRMRALTALEMGAVFLARSNFVFSDGLLSENRTFDLSPTELAGRLADVAREGTALVAWIPGPLALPVRVHPTSRPVAHEPEATRLLDRIDGKRSVAELVDGYQPLVVLRGLASLAQQGAIRFQSEPTAPAEAPPPEREAPLPAEGAPTARMPHVVAPPVEPAPAVEPAPPAVAPRSSSEPMLAAGPPPAVASKSPAEPVPLAVAPRSPAESTRTAEPSRPAEPPPVQRVPPAAAWPSTAEPTRPAVASTSPAEPAPLAEPAPPAVASTSPAESTRSAEPTRPAEPPPVQRAPPAAARPSTAEPTRPAVAPRSSSEPMLAAEPAPPAVASTSSAAPTRSAEPSRPAEPPLVERAPPAETPGPSTAPAPTIKWTDSAEGPSPSDLSGVPDAEVRSEPAAATSPRRGRPSALLERRSTRLLIVVVALVPLVIVIVSSIQRRSPEAAAPAAAPPLATAARAVTQPEASPTRAQQATAAPQPPIAATAPPAVGVSAPSPAAAPGQPPAPSPAAVPGQGPATAPGQGPAPSPAAAPGRGPAPSPSAVVRTLLDERFGTGAPGWPDDAASTAWWDSLGYHLIPRVPGQHVAIAAPLSAILSDVTVTGLFRKAGGPVGGGYGLIVRAQGAPLDGLSQAGRYYVFEVGDRGEVGAWRREDSSWVDLLPWTGSGAVNGPGENNLAVRATGSQFTFSVNSTEVAQVTDATISSGAVGVFTGGDGNHVLLERFTVATP